MGISNRTFSWAQNKHCNLLPYNNCIVLCRPLVRLLVPRNVESATVGTVDQIEAKLGDLLILPFCEESAGVISPTKLFLQKHVEGILVANAGIIQIVCALDYSSIRCSTFLFDGMLFGSFLG